MSAVLGLTRCDVGQVRPLVVPSVRCGERVAVHLPRVSLVCDWSDHGELMVAAIRFGRPLTNRDIETLRRIDHALDGALVRGLALVGNRRLALRLVGRDKTTPPNVGGDE